MDAFRIIAERKLTEAVEEGLFDNFEGKGKPFDYQKDRDIPAAFRAMYRILKAGNMVPPEMILMGDVQKLKSEVRRMELEEPFSEKLPEMKRKLSDMEIQLKLKMDILRKAFSKGS